MANRELNADAVNDLLYGVLSSLYKVSGNSAAAVMRMAGKKMLEALKEDGITLADGGNHVEEISAKMEKLFKDAKFCDSFKMAKVEDGVNVHVTNCAFWGATKKLKAHGVPSYACPFANLGMAVIQEALDKRSRIDEIKPGANEGDSDIHIRFV